MNTKSNDAILASSFKALTKQMRLTREENDDIQFYTNKENTANISWRFYIPSKNKAVELSLTKETSTVETKIFDDNIFKYNI